MNKAWALTAGLLGIAAVPSSAAGQAYLYWLGDPNQFNVSSMSLHGDVAVVSGRKWTPATGRVSLPLPPYPNALVPNVASVSGDGNAFAGTYWRDPWRVLFHYADGQYTDVLTLHSANTGYFLPTPRWMNIDGSMVVLHQTSGGEQPGGVRLWSTTNPSMSLSCFAEGIGYEMYGFASTPDLSIVIVSQPGAPCVHVNGARPTFVYAPGPTPETGWTVRIRTVNHDGSIMIGAATWPQQPYRWDNHVPTPFPSLVGQPIAMADDASVIVTDQSVWTPANNAMSHRAYLASRGAMFPPGPVTISYATADLSAFAGIAPSPTGPGQQRFIIQFRTSGCDSIDFNNDGLLPDVHDIQEFLSVFSGLGCGTATCNDIDFNNDGQFPDVEDIDALMRVFAGGSCD